MANIKANIKNIRKTKTRNVQNKIVITGLKTTIKNSRNAPSSANTSAVYKKADSALAKGKIPKNKANRIKSRLTKAANKANKK